MHASFSQHRRAVRSGWLSIGGLVIALFAIALGGCEASSGSAAGWQKSYKTFYQMIALRAQKCPYPAINPQDFRSEPPLDVIKPLLGERDFGGEDFLFHFVDANKQPNGPVVTWSGQFKTLAPVIEVGGEKHERIVEFEDLKTEYQSKESFANDHQGAVIYNIFIQSAEGDVTAWTAKKPGETVSFTARLNGIVIEGEREIIGVKHRVSIHFADAKPVP